MAFDLADYEPVSARIAKFYADHPKGRVATRLIDHDVPGEWVVMAAIFREDDDKPWATGLAHETPEGHVNKTSALENCETSAVGRALANAGYAGTDPEKRASREEMAKVARGGGTGGGSGGAPAAGSSSDPFKDVLLNPGGWFDNRFDKQSQKAPDFKAKKGNAPWDTAGEYNGKPAAMALWLSDAPPGFHEALESGDVTLCYPQNPPAARGATREEAEANLAAQLGAEEFSDEAF